MQITAIILAGGKSKRMGRDKALLKLEGNSLLKRAIVLCETVCSQILISSNKPEHAKYGVQIIPDEVENCGPIGGIYSCIKKSKTDWNFVISVDSPLVEPEFVRSLVTEIKDFDAIVPVSDKGKEPLIALYHKNSLVEIKERINAGNYKMQDLVDSLNTKWLDASYWLGKYPKLFHNINQPEDITG